MKKCLELAKHLFFLQIESLANDAHDTCVFNDWIEKYGEQSVDIVENKLTIDHPTIQDELQGFAQEIKKDFNTGFWKGSVQYYSAMFSIYGGFIDDTLEKQLALLSGVGYQKNLEL